jgi:hypothetical protein
MYHRHSFVHACYNSEVIYWRLFTQLMQRYTSTSRRKLGKKYSCHLDAPHPSCPLSSPHIGARGCPSSQVQIMLLAKAGPLIPGSPPRSGPVSLARGDYVTVSNMTLPA